MKHDNAVKKGCAGGPPSVKHFIGAKTTVLHFLAASEDSNRIAKLLALIATDGRKCEHTL